MILQARRDSMYGLKERMKRLCLEAFTIRIHHTVFVTHKLVLLCFVKYDICRLAVIMRGDFCASSKNMQGSCLFMICCFRVAEDKALLER